MESSRSYRNFEMDALVHYRKKRKEKKHLTCNFRYIAFVDEDAYNEHLIIEHEYIGEIYFIRICENVFIS